MKKYNKILIALVIILAVLVLAPVIIYLVYS
ncbi:hypothetical protein CAT7_02979 [Carnobacterium sp. AT7]|nr:hypothetical protein CAT7_02979 [Carnobacterium sp. AT7]